ncbi:MAG: hypothetical protein LQ338_000109 [Usnochroma carphineum]|nr:MAG: hypothetical protein LQ338_000109 [Usnochroma carphineum]
MLFPPQLTLSAIYNTANILTALLHYSQPLPATATLAADILFALSLLASGIWLCLAATTAIDGNTALAIHFAKHSRYQYYSSPDHAKIANINSAIEIVGIALTFLAATLHILPCLLSRHHHHHIHHPPIKLLLTDPESDHHLPLPLTLHPALRGTGPGTHHRSPLPYPNPNHPNCAYPPLAHTYEWRASPGGVHDRVKSVDGLSVQCIGTEVSTETLDGKARVV